MVGPAEPLAGLDDLVEHRLDARAARDGAENAADRALLFAQVLDLASELGIAMRRGVHARSLSREGKLDRGVNPDLAAQLHSGEERRLGRLAQWLCELVEPGVGT